MNGGNLKMAGKCVECSGELEQFRGARKGVEYSAYKCKKCGEEIMTLGQASKYLDDAKLAKTVCVSRWGKSLGIRIPAAIAKKFKLSEKSKAEIIENKSGFQVIAQHA